MTDDERLSALERELGDLGPLMAEQESLERRGPDPVFTAQLRARLVAQAAQRPPVTERRRRRLQFPRLSLQWGGLGAAALAAAAVLLLVVLRGGGGKATPTVKTAWVPPSPSSGDITKGYPSLGGMGGGGPAVPTQSRIPVVPGGGQAFPGHLQLAGGNLPSTPSAVRAYRLEGPSSDVLRVTRIARALEINGPVRRVRDLEDVGAKRLMSTWVVVKEGSGETLRSVAISTRTGRMIYHNGSLDTTRPGIPPGPGDVAARGAARQFLTQLGWPGATMPQGPPNPLSYRDPHLTYVSLWWPDGSPSDFPAAAFYVGHGPLVKDGVLLPPIKDSSALRPRAVQNAWNLVRAGKAPVGVEDAISVIAARGENAGGTGTLDRVTVTYIVTPAPNGTLYLVPAYRFSGTAHFPGVSGAKTWLALVPATR